MADELIRYGRYPMLLEEPLHCAESILEVLLSLWQTRTRLSGAEMLLGSEILLKSKKKERAKCPREKR